MSENKPSVEDVVESLIREWREFGDVPDTADRRVSDRRWPEPTISPSPETVSPESAKYWRGVLEGMYQDLQADAAIRNHPVTPASPSADPMPVDSVARRAFRWLCLIAELSLIPFIFVFAALTAVWTTIFWWLGNRR